MSSLRPALIGSTRDQELLKDATSYVYKTSDHGDLAAHCFFPDDFKKTDQRTAVIFFHGGQWDQSMVTQFVPQALHFVTRGAVGIVVEYRTKTVHQTSPMESILDAQSAILWLRKNHKHLGIDPEKVVAGGSGSGAHIALCAAMHKKVENDGFYSAQPNALILFSAIVDTTKKGVGHSHFPIPKLGAKTSPSKHVRSKLPPSIFFHGKSDPIVPIGQVEKFCARMKRKRNICRIHPFDRGTHSFFNFNVDQHRFVQTLESADGFLCEQGFLSVDPEGFA